MVFMLDRVELYQSGYGGIRSNALNRLSGFSTTRTRGMKNLVIEIKWGWSCSE